MFVSMWMTKDVTTITPDTSLTDIATTMSRQRIRRLPVLESSDPHSKLLGMVSSQDVLHAFPADVNPLPFVGGGSDNKTALPAVALKAKDIMSTDLITTSPETPIEEVARLMRENKIGALPVMRHEVLVGLITESDLFSAFANIFDPGSHGVRITFDNSRGEDVFPLIAQVTHHHRLRVTSFVSLLKHERPVCVVQVIGQNTEAMLNDIWKSHHQVISVIQVNDPNAGKDK
ncbi:MAG TPA: CBS domain-containing protein [Steroidobacteraceae bacterium]|nr:CBS domain-containing protein [Steroidobacteraceae bacterium]